MKQSGLIKKRLPFEQLPNQKIKIIKSSLISILVNMKSAFNGFCFCIRKIKLSQHKSSSTLIE